MLSVTASVAAAMASPVSVALSEDGEAGEMISKVISKDSPVLRFRRLLEFSLTISAIRILL